MAVGCEAAVGQTFNCATGDLITYDALVRECARAAGVEADTAHYAPGPQAEGFKYRPGSAGSAVSPARGGGAAGGAAPGEGGREADRRAGFPAGAFVLLADDFTNSGSTLFGGAQIIRRHAEGDMTVCAYVTHYVAKYDRATVSKFVSKMYSADAALDEFHCTDSIPNVIGWLKDELEARQAAAPAAPRKVHVMPLAPLIGDWILAKHAPRRARWAAERARQECRPGTPAVVASADLVAKAAAIAQAAVAAVRARPGR